VPFALTLLLFEFHGGARRFVEYNFLLNAQWPVRFSPIGTLRRIFVLDPVLCTLGGIGFVVVVAQAARSRGGAARLLAVQLAGIVGGAFFIPVPYLQYFVMALPLVAILGARALTGAVLAETLPPPPSSLWRPLLVAAALLLAALSPLRTMERGLHPDHPFLQRDLARIRFIVGTTSLDDTIFDGFTGSGAFRKHAWFYFFLHGEVRALLGAPEIGRLQAELRDGDIAPAGVLFDDEVEQLHEEVVSFLRANYEPTGDGVLWRPRRRELDGALHGRLDLGEGEGDALAGRGWAEPERVGDRSVRRTRGRRSTLRVPLLAPVNARVVVRALSEAPPAGALLELGVNGASMGTRPILEGWTEYAFEVPASAWRRGVNRVRLGHAARGEPGDDDQGTAVTLAVDDLLLQR
jgi:hypothetical protein